MDETKVARTIAVFDSDGNVVMDDANGGIDEAIHLACETVIDTWPDYEVATVGYALHVGEHYAGTVEVAKVSRGHTRGTRIARVWFPDTSFGLTIEVPVGGFKKRNGA